MKTLQNILLNGDFKAWREVINALDYPVFIINSRRHIVLFNQKAKSLFPESDPDSLLCHKLIYNTNCVCDNCEFFSRKGKGKKNGDCEPGAGFVVQSPEDDEGLSQPVHRSVIRNSQNEHFIMESVLPRDYHDELQDRLVTLGAVSLTLAHEISNPITGLNLSIQSLKNTLARETISTSQKLRQIVDLIEKDIQRASGILTDIQNYGKPFSFSAKLTNVRRTIEGALRYSLRTNGLIDPEILWKWDTCPEICVIGNRRKLEQVFINLFKNAQEAFIQQKPEVKFIIEIEGRKLESSGSSEEIEVTIRDNAGGIQREALEKIFSPCYSTKKDHTGMGLFIVQKIIEEHGGEIRHSSEALHTNVSIRLPIAR